MTHTLRPSSGADEPAVASARSVPSSSRLAPHREERRLGLGLLGLAAALAGNSLLGPLVADRIDYPVSASMRNQTIGLDAAGLAVVAPLLALVGALVLSGRRRAAVAALGPTAWVAYMLVQYVAGPPRLAYPPVLVLQLGLFAGAWLLALQAWRLATMAGPPADELPRWHGIVSWAMGAFVLLRYVPGLVGSASEEPLPSAAAADPAMYWLIVLLDLGVYLPVATLVGLGLWRRRPWAPILHRAASGWFALITIAVAAMSAAMLANDDPDATAGQLVLFAVLSAVTAAYAACLHRVTLLRGMMPGCAR